MADPKGWVLKCKRCQVDIPSIVTVRFSFDGEGTLLFEGVCRFCMRGMTVSHSKEEIDADILYHQQQVWLEEEMEFDEWETEFVEGENDESDS